MKKLLSIFSSITLIVSIVLSNLPLTSAFSGLSPTLLSPIPNSTLTSNTVTLNWTNEDATCYNVAVGTQYIASADIAWVDCTTETKATITNLPTNGQTIYIRLFSVYGPNYTPATDFTLTAYDQANPPIIKKIIYTAPKLIFPTPKSTLSSDSTTFSWTNVNANSYNLAIGSRSGWKNYGYYTGITDTSYVINNLPTNGKRFFVTITANYDKKVRKNTYQLIASKATTTPPTPSPEPTPEPTPAPTPTPSPAPSPNPTPLPIPLPNPLPTTSQLSAIWANDGGEKITRDEQRATSNPVSISNSIWDNTKISTFGAKNEVVNFNLILEAKSQGAKNISVNFNTLTGPNGSTISSKPPANPTNDLFNWTSRDIELFYIRYLPIKGLSRLSYETYDERHIPEKLRRPYTGEGLGTGTWDDRPNHDKYYPEIAVPLELKPTFDIAPNENQSIWADIYIPKTAAPGLYTGNVQISENGSPTKSIPVNLTVKNFTLPDSPNSKTMVFYSQENVNKRFFGTTDPADPTAAKNIRDQFFKVAHRHKISLIDADPGATDTPTPEWLSRLNGTLFTAANGYRGPGENTGNNVYSIGTYGSWDWKDQGEAAMRAHSDAWVKWFEANSPTTEFFLYLIDESSDYPLIQKWANWIHNNPGPGQRLKAFATIPLPDAIKNTPSLDIIASWLTVGDRDTWETSLNTLRNLSGKKLFLYNGKRPSNGSFATEDDGIALRQLAWAQYKKGIARWYFWESTYYNNYQGGQGETPVFQKAQTFGGYNGRDNIIGETGWNYSNGDGVLFYPGTDKFFSNDSYNINGPITSIRLKEWRRGIQDVDYLTLAAAKNPTRVAEIVASMIPKVLWEYGINDPSDPTWVRSNISWSTNPNVWEAARAELAGIIEQ